MQSWSFREFLSNECAEKEKHFKKEKKLSLRGISGADPPGLPTRPSRDWGPPGAGGGASSGTLRGAHRNGGLLRVADRRREGRHLSRLAYIRMLEISAASSLSQNQRTRQEFEKTRRKIIAVKKLLDFLKFAIWPLTPPIFGKSTTQFLAPAERCVFHLSVFRSFLKERACEKKIWSLRASERRTLQECPLEVCLARFSKNKITPSSTTKNT